MKHLPFAVIILLFVAACSSTNGQSTDEERIATSVASTVAAQTNSEATPTDSSVAQATELPPPTSTLTPAPTQSPTLELTATSAPLDTSQESPQVLRVGDTIENGFNALTIDNVSLGDSYVNLVGIEQKAREGYIYVILDYSFIAISNTLQRTEKIRATIKDKDGDSFACPIDGRVEFGSFPPGYGWESRNSCEIPVTIAHSLDELKLEISDFDNQTYTFSLGERTENASGVKMEKERDKHFPMAEGFTITCGTQYRAEFELQNPRWRNIEGRIGEKILELDMQISNLGKVAVSMPEIRPLFYPPAMALIFGFYFKDAVWSFGQAAPGETTIGEYRIVMPETQMIPLAFEVPQDCEVLIGDHIISSGDYFVVEINTAGAN